MKLKKTVGYIAIGLVLGAFFAGCDSVNQDWETAAARNNIGSYEEFLNQHPNSRYESDAKKKLLVLKEQEAKQQEALNAIAKANQEAQITHDRIRGEIEQLTKNPSPTSVSRLIEMLEEQQAKIKDKPVFVSGNVGFAVGLGALSWEGTIREMLCEALGQLKDKAAVPVLIGSLKDPEGSILMMSSSGNTYTFKVREAASQALTAITGQNFGKDAVKWQKWQQENQQK
jgi:HEAT repeat protein